MKSPFKKYEEVDFDWDMIGNIDEGRANLGENMPVSVYRLFEYTMRSVLIKNFGKERASALFRESGKTAGMNFAKHLLNTNLELDDFIKSMQATLAEMKIGVLRVEKFNKETGEAVLTVAEDLDCSGLPVIGETVCDYDEGFIAGILSEYSGLSYIATEVDCWAKGDRVCRFVAKIQE